MKCKNQMILCALATLLLVVPRAVSAGSLAEYTITPSSPLAYYHYPAPTGNQFRETPQRLSTFYKPATQQKQLTRPTYAKQPRQQQQYATTSYKPQEQQQVAYQPQQQQYAYQPQQQEQQQHIAYQPQQQQQQFAYQPQQPRTIQQFAMPALEHAAFTLALTSQGYELGAPAIAVRTATSNTMELQSLNVRLPLPIGLTPLNNAPLPLQSGASFSSLPRDVTSYGTKHPLKKVR